MTRTDTAAEVGLHVFERAGLGKAPFRCIGMFEKTYQACHGAPVQPGGCCDYCSNGIRYVYQVRGKDGRVFGVGSDCVRRTGDAGLIRSFRNLPEVREANRLKARHKDDRAKADWAAIMADPAARAKLAEHTVDTRRGKETWLAFAERAWGFCGAAGRGRYLRTAKRMLAGVSTETER